VDPTPTADDSWRVAPEAIEQQPARAPALQVGESFAGQFTILALLGQGGMGQVFRARDSRSGREVALKVLRARLGERSLERFRREGELTARLEHPGIVRIHSAGVADGRPYLVYELVEGGRTLADAIETLEQDAGLELLEQVAEALGFAHTQGVIHRDVKPANVLLDSGGRPRVADFGLARAVDLQPITHTGALLGTPYYMAPEVLTGASRSGPPADVWSLGVMLYRLLAGALPFDGANAVELMQTARRAAPRPLRARDPSISPALAAVCMRCLAARPEDRYPDASALARDLRACRLGEPRAAVGARPRGGLLVGVLVAALALAAVALALAPRETPGDVSEEPAAPVDPARVEEALRRGELELALATWLEGAWERPAGAGAASRRERAARAFEAALEAAPRGSSLAERARRGLAEAVRTPPSVERGAGRRAAQALWEGQAAELQRARVATQLELCERVLELDPQFVPAASLRARLQFVVGEPGAALDACLAVAHRAPSELDTLWRLLQQARASEAALPGSGRWQRLVAAAEGAPPGSERAVAEALLLEARGPDPERERRALAKLDALLSGAPAHPPARILRGLLRVRAGELGPAEVDLDLARELAPSCALRAFYCGLLRARRGEPTRAVAAELVQAAFLGHPVWEAGWGERFPELARYTAELESIARAQFFQRGVDRRSPYGRLEEVQPDGAVVGWAVDPDTPGDTVGLHLFVDGTPSDGAPVLAEAVADRPRPVVAVATCSPGGHGFRVQLPESLRDGREHRLYVFALDTAGEADNPQLVGSGLSFRLAR